MGIFLLKNYVNGNISSCSTVVSLTDEAAKTGKPVTLIVDGWGLVGRCMDEIVEEGSVKGWEWVQGGDYEIFHDRLKHFVESLREGGVELVVFFDPARGTTAKEEMARKADEMKRRRAQRIESKSKALMILNGGLKAMRKWESDEGASRIWELPAASGWQTRSTLASLGVEVVTLDREADSEMVLEMNKRDAFAILADDSDFLVLRGSRYIQFQDVNMNKNGQVKARLYTPQGLASTLQLPLERMHEFASICGNDITRSHVPSIAAALDIPMQTINEHRHGIRPQIAANCLKRLIETHGGSLAGHPKMVELAEKEPAVAQALRDSENFFNITSDAPDEQQGAAEVEQGCLLEHLVMQVRTGKSPGWLLGVARHGKVVCGDHVEYVGDAGSGINMSTRPLRQAMYTLLGRESVVESFQGVKGVEVEGLGEDVVERAVGSGGGLMPLLRGDAWQRRRAFAQLVELACGNEPDEPCSPSPGGDEVSALRDVPETVELAGGHVAPLREIARVMRFVVMSAHPSIQVKRSYAEAACMAALLLHADADAMRLPPGQCNARHAIFAAHLLECGQLLSGISDLIRGEDVGYQRLEPRKLFSARIFVNAVQPKGIESPHIRTLASAKGVTSEIVSLALKGLKFSGGSDRDAAAAQSEGVSSSAAASTKPTSGTLQASFDKTVGGGGQTQQGKGGDKDVENMLPIEAFREDILARVSVEGVTTINGETGCGKSSMVPKFLLDRALEKGVKANIIVCQPRRIAAVSLAKRVAGLYGEDMGGKVGYRVGHGERCVSSKTKITYVTVGWLLQHLSFNPEKLSSYSHVVLDEVHERSLESDLLCLLLKKYMEKESKCPKLVIMSATLQAELFGRYFSSVAFKAAGEPDPQSATTVSPHAQTVDCSQENGSDVQPGHVGATDEPAGVAAAPGGGVRQITVEGSEIVSSSSTTATTTTTTTTPEPRVSEAIFVGARRYPVDIIYLEQLASKFPEIGQSSGHYIAKTVEKLGGVDKTNNMKAIGAAKNHLQADMQRLICDLISKISSEGTCVLIFLPGLSEIINLRTTLESWNSDVPLQIHVLHSLVPDDEQSEAILPAQPGHCKIVLATNIAETSITIPDVTVVIDSGLHRQVTYDSARRIQMLMMGWNSKASSQQRAGRAGRVSRGTVIRLYTEKFRSSMREFDDPEILRTPLERTVLRAKLMMPAAFGSVSHLLAQTLSPPGPGAVPLAVRELYLKGALLANDEDSAITGMGRAAIAIPVDLKLVKLLMLGRAFGALNECIIIATALSVGDVFSQPNQLFIRDTIEYGAAVRRSLKARYQCDDGDYSDAMGYLTAYKEWITTRRTEQDAYRMGVSRPRMQLLCAQIAHISAQMRDLLEHEANGGSVRRDRHTTSQASIGSRGDGKEGGEQAESFMQRSFLKGGDTASDQPLASSLNPLLRLREVSIRREVISRETVGDMFQAHDDLLRVLMFGALQPDILVGKVAKLGLPDSLKKKGLTTKMEQDIASRTIQFKVENKTHMRKTLLGAFFLALGISVESMGIKSRKKREVWATVSPSPPRENATLDDACFDVKLLLGVAVGFNKNKSISLPMQNVRDLEASVVFTGDNETDDWDTDTKEPEDNRSIDEKVADMEANHDPDGVNPFSASEMSNIYRKVLEEFEDDAEIVISGIASSSRIHWVLEKDRRTSVHLYRRSCLSFASDVSLPKTKERMAVAATLMGGQTNAVQATGATIMPTGLFAHVARLVFEPKESSIEFRIKDQKDITAYQIDHTSDDEHEVQGSNSGSSERIYHELRPYSVTMSDLNVINRIRVIASHAITGSLHSDETSVSKQKEAKAMMACLLTMMRKEAKEKALAGDENSVWVTPNMSTGDEDNMPGSYLPPFEIDFEAIRASEDRVDEAARNAAKDTPLGFEIDLSLASDEDEPIEAYKISRQEDLVVGSQPRRRAMDMDDVLMRVSREEAQKFFEEDSVNSLGVGEKTEKERAVEAGMLRLRGSPEAKRKSQRLLTKGGHEEFAKTDLEEISPSVANLESKLMNVIRDDWVSVRDRHAAAADPEILRLVSLRVLSLVKACKTIPVENISALYHVAYGRKLCIFETEAEADFRGKYDCKSINAMGAMLLENVECVMQSPIPTGPGADGVGVPLTTAALRPEAPELRHVISLISLIDRSVRHNIRHIKMGIVTEAGLKQMETEAPVELERLVESRAMIDEYLEVNAEKLANGGPHKSLAADARKMIMRLEKSLQGLPTHIHQYRVNAATSSTKAGERLDKSNIEAVSYQTLKEAVSYQKRKNIYVKAQGRINILLRKIKAKARVTAADPEVKEAMSNLVKLERCIRHNIRAAESGEYAPHLLDKLGEESYQELKMFTKTQTSIAGFSGNANKEGPNKEIRKVLVEIHHQTVRLQYISQYLADMIAFLMSGVKSSMVEGLDSAGIIRLILESELLASQVAIVDYQNSRCDFEDGGRLRVTLADATLPHNQEEEELERIREKLGFWGCLPSSECSISGMVGQGDSPQEVEEGTAMEQDMSLLRARSRLVSAHGGMSGNWSLKRGNLLAQSPSHFRSLPSSLGRRPISSGSGRQLSSAAARQAQRFQGQRMATRMGSWFARGALKLLR